MLKFRADEAGARRIVGVGLIGGNLDRLRLGNPILAALSDWYPDLEGSLLIAYAATPESLDGLVGALAAIGPTGRFPYGPLSADDEGEIAFMLSSDRETETVRLDFGKELAWVAMRPERAEELAAALLEHARRARR